MTSRHEPRWYEAHHKDGSRWLARRDGEAVVMARQS